MVQQEQIPGCRIQTPEAGDGGQVEVLVALRIKMRRTVARPVAGENDPFIRAVGGADIVVIRRLVWDFGDDRRGSRVEKVRDLVKLPVKRRGVVGVGGGAHHHAEHRLRPAPMNRGLADRDAVRVLRARNAVAGGAGQIPGGPVGIADVQVAAARRPFRSAKMIAKSRCDRDKTVRDHIGIHLGGDGNLGDEEDRIRRAGGPGAFA